MFYVGAILIIASIATIVYSIIDNTKHDIYTGSALTVEIGIGIVISWIVFIYSKKWDKENKKVTADIKVLTENLKQITEDVRKTVIEESNIRKEIVFDISYHLNGHLKTVIMTLEHSLKMYENCKNSTGEDRDHWFIMMKESYSRPQNFLDLRMNLVDLMKIYGVRISRLYWRLIGELQINSSLFRDVGIDSVDELAGLIQESLSLAKELKDLVEPLGTLNK